MPSATSAACRPWPWPPAPSWPQRWRWHCRRHWAWPATNPGLRDWLAAGGLAVLASGLAYILYFRLISRVGPTGASSVTFLVPVSAALWGGIFLDEVPTLSMLLGGVVILCGTALVLGLLPLRPRPRAGST